MRFRTFLALVGLILVLFSYSFAQVPQMINYHGKLTKSSGAVLDTTVQMIFSIYADSNGTVRKWTETQGAVKVDKGVFNVLLGSVNPIPDSVFDGTVRYLGLKVGGDPEITPRNAMVSVPYAYRSGSGGSGGDVGWTDNGNVVRLTTSTDSVGIGTTSPAEKLDVVGKVKMTGFKMPTGAINGYVLTSDVYGEGTWKLAPAGGGDLDWSFRITDTADTTLISKGRWGLARYGNILYGNADSTHVNLGVACTTGTSGVNFKYSTVGGGVGNAARGEWVTVGGGYRNIASDEYSFVGGGASNTASGPNATVGGGYYNIASGNNATVGGGDANISSGGYSTVGGGSYDTASGNYATVPGGYANKASATYSFAAGRRAKAIHDGSFVWGDNTNADFASTNSNQFLIRASNGVGINKAPAYALDVNGTAQMTGFRMPTGASAGRVLTSDASGVGTWQATSGGDLDWTFRITDTADTTLISKGRWGLARFGNILYGNADSTHVNLGVACTTGTNGYNWKYSTVGGGRCNTASYEYTTVGGGSSNRASGQYTTVGGGVFNAAIGVCGTVGGGYRNTASGYLATVGGGYYDTANGEYATVSGGRANKAAGDYSFAAGLRAKALHAGSFVWADSSNEDFPSTGVEQFLIRASGGVGIGKNNPAQQLDVNGTVQMTGFKLPTGASAGKVLTTDSSGMGTWQAPGSDGDWILDEINHTLFTGGNWAIARHDNVLFGNNSRTHVNLGVACTTGTSGLDNGYATVGGGSDNAASGNSATVAGGHHNTASGMDAIVGCGSYNSAGGFGAAVLGGSYNIASTAMASIGGGSGNTVSGYAATVGGGTGNRAIGDGATIPGGSSNTASGAYSMAGGSSVQLNSFADHSFAFGNNFTSSTPHAVIFHDSETPISVGIGTANPYQQATLQVASSRRHAGYFTSDRSDGPVYVLNAEYTGTYYDATGIYAKAKPNDGYGTGGYFVGGERGVYSTVYGTGNRSYVGVQVDATGTSASGTAVGVVGEAYGNASTKVGVWGYADGDGFWAGYFGGSVCITGNLSKGGGGFKIDHPLDPQNKYLYHSFVESPDMKNVYDGVAALDAKGEATVTLPDYFEVLNKDFRYQLTSIGAPAPNLHIAERITNNHFKIAGGQPGMEVSWQVTGIRKDPYAESKRIQVEVDKPVRDKGKYLHAEAYGLGEEYGIHYAELKRIHEKHEQKEEELH